MNDSFGDIMQDFLPDGYGEAPSKVVQGLNTPHPTAGGSPEASSRSEGPSLPPYTSAEAPGPTATRTTSPVVSSYSGASQVDIERQAFWGCLSGLPGVARKNATAADPGYRDISETNGYTYRQYRSGRVKIIKGPANKGKLYEPGSEAVLRIEKAYGKYPTKASSSKTSSSGGVSAAEVGTAAGAGFTQILTGLMSSLGPQASVPLDEESLMLTEDVPVESSGTPWGLILGGIGAVVVIGGVVYFATRKPSSEE